MFKKDTPLDDSSSSEIVNDGVKKGTEEFEEHLASARVETDLDSSVPNSHTDSADLKRDSIVRKIFRSKYQSVLILVSLLVASFLLVILTGVNNASLLNYDLEFEYVAELIIQLGIIAVFVERFVEVFLGASRRPHRLILERNIVKHVKNNSHLQPNLSLSKNSTIDYKDFNIVLHHAKEINSESLEEVIRAYDEYRADTETLAMVISFIMGVLVSVVGLRALNTLLETSALNDSTEPYFITLDILITAGIVAGGSSGTHRILDKLKQLFGMNR